MVELENLVPWLLAVFFVLAGTVNFAGPAIVRADFNKWSYPGWFRYLIAILEIFAGILLLLPPLRSLGALVALPIMVGVLISLLRTREFMRLQFPLFLLLLCLGVLLSPYGGR
jgi:uncharacterized membrane protein YphA (DoxX/SURF4 family)